MLFHSFLKSSSNDKQIYESTIIEELKSSDIGLLSHLGVKHFIEEFVDIKLLKKSALELINGAGSLRISKNSLEKHIELGYRDAIVILAPIIIKILKGTDFDNLIKKNDKKTAAYLNEK